MDKFYRWLYTKVRDAGQQIERYNGIENQKLSAVGSTNSFNTNPMNIRVYRAEGGYAVEYNHYDRKKDSNDYQLYIIRDDQDLGAELGRILMVETLRR